MVSWMYNNAKDVKTEIDNTLCAFLVELENNNEKDAMARMAQRAKVSVCISREFSVVPIFDCAHLTKMLCQPPLRPSENIRNRKIRVVSELSKVTNI